MAGLTGMGFFQWMGVSLFAGTTGLFYTLRGVGNGLADLGGLVGDVRRGEIGLVAQVFHQLQAALAQVQQIVSSPVQSLARGMISQESWDRTEESMQRILDAISHGELPNAIDLKDLQLFIELLIPDLMPRRVRGAVPSTVNEWMNPTEQRQLRQLHAVITQWLGEGVDGEVRVAVVDVENILTSFLRVDVGADVQLPERRGRIMRAIDALTGADSLAPAMRVAQAWRAFDPQQLVPNVIEIVTDLCVQFANPDVLPQRKILGIDDWEIHEDKVPVNQLLKMGEAFKRALEEKGIPLYVIDQLTSVQIEAIQKGIRQKAEGVLDGTTLPGFYSVGDGLEVPPEMWPGLQKIWVASTPVDSEDEDLFHDSPNGTIPANRGSEVLYFELMRQSVHALQGRELGLKTATFEDGSEALQGVRSKYRTFFQQPPNELFTIDEALRLVIDCPQLNERQQRTVVNAQAIAQRWRDNGLPADLWVPENRREEFDAALEALTQVVVEYDNRGIVHQPYRVRLPQDAGLIEHQDAVGRALERNEGSLQRPIRQTLGGITRLIDSAGDLINMVITAPRTLLDAYTRPSVVAAIAIGILLLASLLSAIFSLGSLHFLTALSMAGGLSIVLHVGHRAAASSHGETATRAAFVMAALVFDSMDYLSDKLVAAQLRGSQWLNGKWRRIPVIRHPVTI